MLKRDIVVIGASAGGLEALSRLAHTVPSNLEAALLIVMHTDRHAAPALPGLLNRNGEFRDGKFRAGHPADGSLIKPGRMYVAPPNFHMIVEGGCLRLIQGPRENRSRPAIDPLFRTAAAAYGRRVIGVILTGLLDDGMHGLMLVHDAGGEAIVQDPATARFPSMPASALRQVPAAHVATLDEIPDLLVKLCREELAEETPAPSQSVKVPTKQTRLAQAKVPATSRTPKPIETSLPAAGGGRGGSRLPRPMSDDGGVPTLETEKRQAVESALWAALRALKKQAALYRRIEERINDSTLLVMRREYSRSAAETEAHAAILQRFLLNMNLAGKTQSEWEN